MWASMLWSCLLLVQLLVEDHNLRWRLYGSPLEIIELSNEVSAALVKDRARFLDDMLLQQVTKLPQVTKRVERSPLQHSFEGTTTLSLELGFCVGKYSQLARCRRLTTVLADASCIE